MIRKLILGAAMSTAIVVAVLPGPAAGVNAGEFRVRARLGIQHQRGGGHPLRG
jgi:hypothetical protein